jgi:uncharacterized protein YdiU (UPF0061 family)
MFDNKADFTNSFTALLSPDMFPLHPIHSESGISWVEEWKRRISSQNGGINGAKVLMELSNPVYIPRNHLVEEALDQAIQGDMRAFEALLQLLKNPYQLQSVESSFLNGIDDFRTEYKTYCGT